MKAILIVDVQNDFCSGGALAVKDGDDVVHIINSIIDKFDFVVSTQDWHPEKTVHFEKWPVHCVANTFGSEFHTDLKSDLIDLKLLKGTEDKDDGYSGFEATNYNLIEELQEKGVKEVYVCGLATDYCVRASALDAIEAGFDTYVIEDAIKAVNLEPNDGQKAIDEMIEKGIIIISSEEI